MDDSSDEDLPPQLVPVHSAKVPVTIITGYLGKFEIIIITNLLM